jgi:ABC-type multidrug transport system ATPase subunit
LHLYIDSLPITEEMENVLTLVSLEKRFGKIQAVSDLSLQVNKGNVYGFLGPNGSGKTTALGIVLGVVRATSGSFSWFNEPNHKIQRKRIGAILELPLFYPYLSLVNNLKIFASIKEAPFEDIERTLKIVDLWDRRLSRFKTLSLGMKQRLALASALLGNPEVLIFDEPTNGLDPTGIAEVREMIIRIANQGTTIILASHLLDEVQKTCSHVAVLRNGKKLFDGQVEDVLGFSDTIEISSNNMMLLEIALQEYMGVTNVRREGNILVMNLKQDITPLDLNSYLTEKEIVVTHLLNRRRSLEEQFIEILKRKE